jgi:hypothetical protein
MDIVGLRANAIYVTAIETRGETNSTRYLQEATKSSNNWIDCGVETTSADGTINVEYKFNLPPGIYSIVFNVKNEKTWDSALISEVTTFTIR